MYTVPELTALLGLSTENQVRNRIEAIRGLLVGSIRRGPNNQLLVTEDGLRLLRDLQALCETGHTLTEAANIMRYRAEEEDICRGGPSPGVAAVQVKPGQAEEDGGWRALVEHLAAEVRELAARVSALEARAGLERMTGAWWERWR